MLWEQLSCFQILCQEIRATECLKFFINVILLRKPVIKKRIEYHDALNGKLKKTKKRRKNLNIRIKR